MRRYIFSLAVFCFLTSNVQVFCMQPQVDASKVQANDVVIKIDGLDQQGKQKVEQRESKRIKQENQEHFKKENRAFRCKVVTAAAVCCTCIVLPVFVISLALGLE